LFPEDKLRARESLRFVGYLMLDALVGNTDRHHENWGVVLKPTLVPALEEGAESQVRFHLSLAPTFDHGSSLGRELLEDRARQILADPQGMSRYFRKATGGIFENELANKGLSPLALVELIAASYPELVRPWRNRIEVLPEDFAEPLLVGVPTSCMSEASREFVLAFLSESRKIIASIL